MAQALTRPWHAVRGAWQRSIQVRVITATLALSLIVVILLGTTLMRQISDGLLETKADSAVADASAGVDYAQRNLDAAADTASGSWSPLLSDITQSLTNRGNQPGSDALYEVVMLGSEDNAVQLASPGIPLEWVPGVIPETLREHVRGEERVFHTYTAIPDTSSGAPTGEIPALAVGGQVTAPTGDEYELYYLFPLTEQQAAIDLVRTALVTAGLLLLLLLGALAWLVTRQVVTPVRLAARIAERFSAGNLSERMAVRGRDDLARLAASFNQMAASLQHQIGQLEELSRMQQQFVSDVSHELRTPLTTVRMAADVLHESRETFDPVVHRSAELLQAQLDRFEALLNDLLEISRFDAGAAVLNAERHDLRDLVQSVIDAAEPLAERKGSQIVQEMPNHQCVAEIDSRRIERVLRNLVVNAVEHGEGNDVIVRVAADDNAVAVSVRDYGVGLKPGESSLVFHRFWRADRARARTTGGTGLGLSISLEDARLHGGWLQAWGEPGAGSQFRLTLPRRAGEDITTSPLTLVPADANDLGNGRLGVGGPYQSVTRTEAETPGPGAPEGTGRTGASDGAGTTGTTDAPHATGATDPQGSGSADAEVTRGG
ncbi:MtrAB system histidine kinase MtrB [Phytoactinopolyspora halotolerans]|uniref:Sensor histidine kinase MtrB n=1 Tax=Phytoactinopolyspora halotolerans TaxID=1981512 RepID=A0A6L9SD10_9ACTN|nr:MtrAB system histidine kinase MtrB [Phytoactinopolyspora halotolerans]NEE02472.1 HAMP domain-containing histidine kinase [Phytoactinopolyspora halotolerans]